MYCPGWVAGFRWLKPFLDDQVAALGWYTSAYNESVVKRP